MSQHRFQNPHLGHLEGHPPYIDSHRLHAAIKDKLNRPTPRMDVAKNIQELDEAGRHREAALLAYFLGCLHVCDKAAKHHGVLPTTLRVTLKFFNEKVSFVSFTLKNLQEFSPDAFRNLPPELHLELVQVMRTAVDREDLEAYAVRVEEASKNPSPEFPTLRDELLRIISTS